MPSVDEPNDHKPWSDVPSAVLHLTEKNFKEVLVEKKHALVIFYANWCGQCKKTKPEFQAAANKLKEKENVVFAALDCVAFPEICKMHKVDSYPTIRYYKKYKVMKEYSGARNEHGFYNYMADKE